MKIIETLRSKIGRRLLLSFLIVALIPLITAAWLAVERGQAELHRQTQATLRAAADGAEAQVREFLAYLKARTLDFGSDAFIRAGLETLAGLDPGDLAAARLADDLSAYLAAEKLPLLPEAVETFVLDRDGRVVASSSARVGEDHSQMDYFLHGQGAVFVSDVFRDPASGAITWLVAAPVTARESGARLGVLVNRIDPRVLSDVTTGRRVTALGARTQSLRIGETGETYLVNRDRLMITESRFLDDAVLNVVVDTQPVRLALEQDEEMMGNYPDYRGVPISGASMIVEEPGWVILAEIDFSQAFVPVQRLRNTLIGLTAGLTLAVLLVAAGLTRRIIEPVRRMVEANLALARGETSGAWIPEDDIPDDEIGAIARSRQEMLARLDAAQAELRQRLKELSTLNATAALLSRSLHMEEVLGRILDKVIEITGMDAAEISLLEPLAGRLRIRAQRGFSSEWLAEEADRPVDCLCGWVAQQDEPLCLAEAVDEPRTTRPACRRDGLRAFWGVPLRAAGQVLGVMSLHSRAARPATPQERDLLAAIGSQIGVALTNIHLYQEVQHLSLTDALTGLRNRRALEERLHEESRRAERYRRPLSVIMADIDHFKAYNDAHGHPQGDAILQQVAGLIQAQARETDFVARYGGEEFTVLLPETPKAAGLEVAERMRAAVAGQRFPRAETQPGGRLTVSLGVAAFPEDAAEAHELIHRADQALYRAKNAGRDRVCAT